MRRTTTVWSGLLVATALSLTACTPSASTGMPTPVTVPAPSTTSPNANPSGSPTSRPPTGDLRTGRETRTLRDGRLRMTVEYSLQSKVKDWEPGVSQPVTITVTALSESPSERRIYLSQLTGTFSVFDEGEALAAPPPWIDTANISPGYAITSPKTYDQVFMFDAAADGATQMRVDLRYELLLGQGTDEDSEYAKRTVTDVIDLALPGG